MAFGGQVVDRRRLHLGIDAPDRRPVADIDLLEAVQLRPRQVGDIVRIAGIGQLVDGHDRLALRIQPAHQRRTDEAGAAGNVYSHVPFTPLWRSLAGGWSCSLVSRRPGSPEAPPRLVTAVLAVLTTGWQ